VASICDGTLDPSMVIQKTSASIASMMGKPSHRLVSSAVQLPVEPVADGLQPRSCARSAISCAAA
jgi:hypothetical protein